MFGLDFIVIFVTITTVSFLTYLLLGRQNKYKNLPPGPWPYPLIGNVRELMRSDRRQLFEEYRGRYGNIFTVYRFNNPVIVINGYEDIKEIFVKNGNTFPGRPDVPILRPIFKGKGVFLSEGKVWKHNRRFLVQTLKYFGMSKSKLQFKIHEELVYFLDAIERRNGQPFDIRDAINAAISNIMCSVVFGKRSEYEDEDFSGTLKRLDQLAKSGLIFKPSWFKYIPGDPFNVDSSTEQLEVVRTFLEDKVKDHFNTFDQNETRDLIDAYIKQMKDYNAQESSSIMNEDELVMLVRDLFTGGTETTVAALRFSLIYLLRDMDIQSRLYDELSEIVPNHRLPELSDKKQLPLLEATICETLRRSGIISIVGARRVDEDFQYKGYTFPKSATITPNLESVLLDGEVFDEPLAFNPFRFLDNGQPTAKIEEFIPFGIGSRICPGEALARMEIFMFLSAMLQRFKFIPPKGEASPGLEKESGTVETPKPFRLRAIKREW